MKLTAFGVGALALGSWAERLSAFDSRSSILPEFPAAELLGRNCTADTSLQWGGTIPIQARPDKDSGKIRDAYRDEVFPWLREVSAERVDYYRVSQRWVETPEGYIWAPYLQPCRNLPNTPLTAMPDGKDGFWVEVTVPYVDLFPENPTPVSGWMRDHVAYGLQPRLYYAQIMWADQIRTSEAGVIQYRVQDKYGNPGDRFWADGRAFRPLSDEDVSPIHPEIDPALKKIVVNINYQTLSCFEGEREVYFCRVSTGVEDGSTPLGEFPIWRKMIATRMGANTVAASYDLPAIPWTTLFVGSGVAIHGATSHNDFGAKRSHGCVNCRPEDAKWIFRWTLPEVTLEMGEIVHQGMTGSTHVFVTDSLY